MKSTVRLKWTREHLLIALNLYCKLPFGRLHKGNPLVIDVARQMRRSPSSLAMKLCNFAALDPIQKARGIKGLSGTAKQDQAIWDEFRANIDSLGSQSEQLLHDLFTQDEDKEVDFLEQNRVRLEAPSFYTSPSGPTEVLVSRRQRRGQQFFRQTILSVFDLRCCISGINVPQLLVASHIKPWSKFPNERLDPQNGLCLSNLHDAAFDSGLITLDADLKVVLSKSLKRFFPQSTLQVNFSPFEGIPIHLPGRLAEPNRDFLRYHREEIFQKS